MYFKYTSLTWNDFDTFFEENKNLGKKDFLKLIWHLKIIYLFVYYLDSIAYFITDYSETPF